MKKGYLLFLIITLMISGCAKNNLKPTKQTPLKVLTESKKSDEVDLDKIEKELEEELKSSEKPSNNDILFSDKKEREKIQKKYTKGAEFIKMDIYSGKIGPISIKNESYKFLQGEVKEICVMNIQDLPVCFWATYQGNSLIFNIEPDKDKMHMSAYIDKNYINKHKNDLDTYTISTEKSEYGLFKNIYLIPKKRGKPLDLEVFIKRIR